jgi:putative transposase
MLKIIKVRIYPDNNQKEYLAQAFGCTRFIWNRFLALTYEAYKTTGKSLSRSDLQKQLPALKKELDWLSVPYSQSLQVVCLNLSRAFINFFEKRASYPRFKSKQGKQSLADPQGVKIVNGNIKLPKIGDIVDFFRPLLYRYLLDRKPTLTRSEAIASSLSLLYQKSRIYLEGRITKH